MFKRFSTHSVLRLFLTATFVYAVVFPYEIGLNGQNITRIVHAVNVSGSPVILSVSETASAGETINVQGGGFDLQATPWLEPVKADGTPDDANRRQLRIANQSPYLIQAIVPSDMPAGLWSLTVQNSDGATSATK